MASHGRERYKIFGSAPEIEKLPNSRFRVIVRCDVGSVPEDWYYANRDRLWRDFGDLYTAPIESGDSWQAKAGEAYPNQALIAQEFKYLQGKDGPVVEFIYETLTDTWPNEDDDDISSTENGLRTLIRQQVALPDTALPYDEDDVGVVTITDGGKTLYLAGFEDLGGEQIGRVVSRWAEAGTLSVSTRLINDGVKQTTYTYLGVEGTPTGTIIARRITSHEGFRTFEIDVLTDTDGETLTGEAGAAKLNFEYQQLVPFTFPGVVDLVREQNHIFPSVRSPVEALVKADVLVYYQSSSNIVSGDFTLDSAIGIWNPSEWCQKISTIDSFYDDRANLIPAYYNAQGIRGCRTRESITVTGDNTIEIRAYTGNYTPATLQLEETTETENGKSIYRQIIQYAYDETTTFFQDGSGAQIVRGPYKVSGTYTVECKWNGSQWNITFSDVIDDPTRTDANAGDLNYTYSLRTNDWEETYTNVSASTSGTLFSGADGGNNPEDATWTGITVGAVDNAEFFSALAIPSDVDKNIARRGFWIEGRNVDNGARGQIEIKGGPRNPLGKRYVLDVNIKKAFDDIDGNTTWMKQVVVADITPV